MMKILLSGYHNPHFETVTEYTEAAIRELSEDVIAFDDRDFWLPGTVREWSGVLHRWDLGRLNRRLTALASAQRPDVCLVQGGHRISSESIRAMKSMGIVTVLWTIDAPGSSGLPYETAPLYDLVMCGGTEAVELLKAAGVTRAHWLPFGCPSALGVCPTWDDRERHAYDSDVCFIGSYYPNRAALLEPLADVKPIIRGPGWGRLSRHSSLRALVRDQQVTPAEWRKMYAAAKIVLAVHYQDGRSPCYQASPRVFEAMACGAFVLCDTQRDVEALFKDGEHLVLFHDADDLRRKITHYLAHPNERLRIAELGRRETMKSHTYRHRMDQMLAMVRTVQARGGA
jgi:spore maturation protein CgeB